MFEAERNRPSLWFGAIKLIDLIYHNTVRSVRKGHRDAVFAILSNVAQMVIMIGAFFIFMDFLGLRKAAVRGDFMLYIMSGIFVFMVHIKALGAVAGAEGPTSAMMQHLPMTPTVSIWAAALSSLYTQFISLMSILLVYHLFWLPLEIHQPVHAIGALLLAWLSGCSMGTVFLAAKPWMPGPVGMVQQVYTRVNMFASGKMFLANNLPSTLVAIFSWNPLFHIIDQGRGFVFINYTPLKTTLSYPLYVALAFLVIGLIGESYSRKFISASWTAGR